VKPFIKSYQFISILLLVLLSTAFCGLQALALDLNTAIHLAEKNNADFRAKQLESKARKSDGWELIAEMGPQLVLAGKIMRSRVRYKADEVADIESQRLTFNDDSVNIFFNQPLLDIEKINRARRGGCEIDIAALELRNAWEKLVVQVVEAYYSLLASQHALDLAKAKLDILNNQKQTAMAGHDLGLNEQSDLFDIQARHATTSAALAEQETKFIDAAGELSELLGGEVVMNLDDLSSDITFSLPEQDVEYWLEQAKEKNGEIRLRRVQMEAARLDGKIGSSRFLPALSFFAEYERTSPADDLNGYGWEKERADFGLKLEMELISGGRDIAGYRALKYRYLASRKQLLATERSISRQVRSTWDALQRTLETVQAYEKAAAANKKSLEIKEANFEEGLQSMLDVLNVQRDYFIVSNRYQNSKYDYATLLYRFKQLVGELQTTP